MMVDEKLALSATVGAWYKARDIEEVRRVFGDNAAKYLKFPRRVSQVIGIGLQQIQFATLGDSGPSVGQTGDWTTKPIWDPHWLVKVKEPCQVRGKRYKIKAAWAGEAEARLQFASPSQAKWFRPDFAGHVVTAEHESYSGYSIWVRSNSGYLACIPQTYLTEVPFDLTGQSKTEIAEFVKLNFMRNDMLIDDRIKFEKDKDKNMSCSGEKMNISVKDKSRTTSADSRIRYLESRLNELEKKDESIMLSSVDFEDDENDLDHSMVLDLPPEIAEWAKKAGIGLEDMLPLAEKICSAQADQNKALAKYEAMVARAKHRCEVDKEFIEYEAESDTIQNEHNKRLVEVISSYRHETMQTFLKWGSAAGTISYVAYTFGGLLA